MAIIPPIVERTFNGLLDHLATVVARSGIHPNTISTVGIIPSIIAALFLAEGWFELAGSFIFLGGILDMIDGKVARSTSQESKFGAIYDATLDRMAELIMYAGFGVYCMEQRMPFLLLITFIAGSSSILISYVRARAESHGISCPVGILRRGDRIVLMAVGAVLDGTGSFLHSTMQSALEAMGSTVMYRFPPMPLTISMTIIAVLAPVTVVQRLLHIGRQAQGDFTKKL